MSKPGLEPTTRPQAGRPAKYGCRKVVCCNHPKTNTPSTLRLRVSPRMPMARRTSNPSKQNGANALGIYLVPLAGIEPTHPDYKTGPLPLRIKGQN